MLGTFSEHRTEFYSGPLPTAEDLDAYNRVSPGLADTIFTEWRTETAHRRRLEQFTLTSQVRAQRLGQIFGLGVALFVIGCGVALSFAGRGTAGLVAIIAPLATLAAVFVYAEIRQNGRR